MTAIRVPAGRPPPDTVKMPPRSTGTATVVPSVVATSMVSGSGVRPAVTPDAAHDAGVVAARSATVPIPSPVRRLRRER